MRRGGAEVLVLCFAGGQRLMWTAPTNAARSDPDLENRRAGEQRACFERAWL